MTDREKKKKQVVDGIKEKWKRFVVFLLHNL
jgi:hypothetical protein